MNRKSQKPGQGKGGDVRGLPPSQEAQDLLVHDVKAQESRLRVLHGDKPGQGEDQEHQPAPGVQGQGEQAGLAPEPGIARQDQQRKGQADKTLAHETHGQAHHEEHRPGPGGVVPGVNHHGHRGHQGQGHQVVGEELQVEGEKPDAGEEDDAPQPGGPGRQQAPADEIGQPDLSQADATGWAGGPPGPRPRRGDRPRG